MQRGRKHPKRSKAGFGLIEVMVAALILAVLIIGGSATMYLTGSNIRIQGHKRTALMLADQRLEIARSSFYPSIAPTEYDVDNKYYLQLDSTDSALLELKSTLTTEDLDVGGYTYTMTTAVLRHSSDSGSVGFDPEALEVSVKVEYGNGTDDAVELSTLLLPPQVAL